MKATGMRAIGRMGVAAAVLAMSVLVTPASAFTRYWDIDGDTAGSGANTTPTGTWDAANPYWSSSDLGDVATVAWTAGDTAVFAAGTDASGAYTVTVSGTIDIGGLTFQEGTVTLAGATAFLRMVANSIFDVATGRSATFTSDAVTISDNGTAHTLTKEGGGTLTMQRRTYTGATIVNAGKLILKSRAVTYSSPLTINSNGIVELIALDNGNNTYSANITVNAGGLLSLPSGTGTSRMQIGGTLTLNGGTVAGPYAIFKNGGSIQAVGGVTSTISAPIENSNNGTIYNIYVESGSTLLISGPVRTGGTNIQLKKYDPGTLILSGNDTYTGATTVSGGCLIIDGNPRTAVVGTITVASGARFGGRGTVSGNVTFSAGSALVFDPARTLTLASGKTLSLPATYTPLQLVAVDGSAIDWDALDCTAVTTFTLVQGAGTVSNFSTDTYVVGTTGRKAFFKSVSGSPLQLEVVLPTGTIISIR